MKLNSISFLFLVLLFFTGCKQEEYSWPQPASESKPWTRWWWPGNAVDKDNLVRELKEMADAGIGGVEITPIYGVQGEEDRFIEFLSPQFSDILKFTIEEANKLGMGVDLPPGSGWRCGGPFVPEEKGLWSLQLHRFETAEGKTFRLPANMNNAVAASFVNEKGEVTVFNPEEDFHAPVSGSIYVAERMKTGDRVKRAADGGKGWAIDTFNEGITNWYLDEFWNRLGIEEGMLRCFFHDSFEYTGDFTPRFMGEFKARRGYDLTGYLHVLAGDYHDAETIARVKSDYRETLSDLVLESFIQPMTGWANRHHSLNRNQAHGSPGNILNLYAACDIPETEIFRTVEPGEVDIFINKFASSAAHVTGQKFVSSESFTWLNEHWTVTTSDMMRATNRFFLSGINHIFFHGTCYSPEDAEWPGWLFYASTQMNNRNPLWRELPVLFKYIERSQTILQQSIPQNDLLVYWPYYDAIANEGPLFYSLAVNQGAEWFWGQPVSSLSRNLMDEGYSFDYISDKQLTDCRIENGKMVTEGNAKYKALVIPKTKYLPVETMKKIAGLLAEGATVFFEEALPESVPGLFNLPDREKQLKSLLTKTATGKNIGNIVELLSKAGINGEKSLTGHGFHFLKLKQKNEDWYMVFNCETEPLDEWVELQSKGKSFVFCFPENGKISRAARKNDAVRIQLEPERAVFIRCAATGVNAPRHVYIENIAESIELKGMWKISFVEGGPVYPGDISTEVLKSWTELGDDETRRFAGTARYSVRFDWHENTTSALIDLGAVKDCATVKLNGKNFGTLPGPAFRVVIDNLVPGENQMEAEVTNVAANRIRDLDRRGVEWKRFFDINFVNIDYEPFDASEWEVRPAGLTSKVMISPL
jgi:hypothetical protein